MGKTTHTEKRQFGECELRFSKEDYSLSGKSLAEADKIISDWRESFPKAKTWVQENLGIPTFALRIDCSVNGSLKVFEINEHPSEIGLMKTIHPEFSKKLERIQSGWPIIRVLVSPSRKNNDDELWLESISLEEAQSNPGPLLIRADPKEEIYQSFEKWSISSLRFAGDKSYGEKMKLWEEVALRDYGRLNWDEGFCLKPKHDSKIQGVEIWHPLRNQLTQEGINGFSTRNKIKKILSTNGTMYYQPFIHPMDSPFRRPMIFRIFYLYNLQKRRYEYAGGIWNDSSNIRVSGAENSVIGLIN